MNVRTATVSLVAFGLLALPVAATASPVPDPPSRQTSDMVQVAIDELTERMIQPEGQYTHRWRTGDVVIWDNRCSYHKAAGDYPPEEDRIHWRVSMKERT